MTPPMATTDQTDAPVWEPCQFDVLQNWLMDDGRPGLHLDSSHSRPISSANFMSPALAGNVVLFSSTDQMLPGSLDQSPLISGSDGTGSAASVLPGSCPTLCSLSLEWPSPEEASLAEQPMASGGGTGDRLPLVQPAPSFSPCMPSYQVPKGPTPRELSAISSRSAWHSSQASPGALEPTSLGFDNAASSALGSPPVTMMPPSRCGPLIAPCCSGMEPLYHKTANGFEICRHASIAISENLPTDPCSSTRLNSFVVDEIPRKRSHSPDVNSPPRKLPARQQRKIAKPEKCPMPGCSGGFPYKRDLERHIAAQHKDTAPQKDKFPCPVPGCDKVYARSDHVTRHRKIKHGAFNAGGHRRKGLKGKAGR